MVLPPASLVGCLRRVSVRCVVLAVLAGSASAVPVRAGTSVAASPQVTFATAGTKSVTLRACNANGCSTTSRAVIVLDPKPVIRSLLVPASASASTVVTLQAAVSGKPPLSASWLLTGPAAQQVTLVGNPASWTTPATGGTWSVRLTLGNGSGSASASAALSVLAQDFADVPITYWAWKHIESIYHRGVTSGCQASPRRYCPEASVDRAAMAVFLLKAKEGPAYVPPACISARFADVPCSSAYAPWINELARRGVTNGCGGGNYCPAALVNRAEIAVFLLTTLQGAGWAPSICTSSSFVDLPCSSPFARWAEELVKRGITAGCAPGAYCPNALVDRAEMAVFLQTTFALPAP